MSDEYPRDEELLRLKKWDFFKEPVTDFIGEIERLWWMPDWGFSLKGKKVLRLELHTGGWSGNESIICWIKSQRGGHYWFEIKLKCFSTPETSGESK